MIKKNKRISRINQVPKEIVEEITNFLSQKKDIFSILICCKFFHSILNSPDFRGCLNVVFRIKKKRNFMKNCPKSNKYYINSLVVEEKLIFSDEFEKFIEKLPNLQFLDVSLCSNIKNDCFKKGNKPLLHNLKTLKCYDSCVSCFEFFPSLRKLYANRAVELIEKSKPDNLKFVRNLRELIIIHSPSFLYSGINVTFKSMKELCNLISIDVNHCFIEKKKEVFKNQKFLRKLNLLGCNSNVRSDIGDILLKNITSLEHLNIQNIQMRDQKNKVPNCGLITVECFRGFKNLKVLILRSNWHLNEEIIDPSVLPSLMKLDIRNTNKKLVEKALTLKLKTLKICCEFNVLLDRDSIKCVNNNESKDQNDVFPYYYQCCVCAVRKCCVCSKEILRSDGKFAICRDCNQITCCYGIVFSFFYTYLGFCEKCHDGVYCKNCREIEYAAPFCNCELEQLCDKCVEEFSICELCYQIVIDNKCGKRCKTCKKKFCFGCEGQLLCHCENYDFKSEKCKNCFEKLLCTVCKHQICESCSGFCPICKSMCCLSEDMDPRCIYSCNECKKYGCRKCFGREQSCYSCGRTICKNCLEKNRIIYCSECEGEPVCERCAGGEHKKCFGCNSDICKECLVNCEQCKKSSCSYCREKNEWDWKCLEDREEWTCNDCLETKKIIDQK